DDFGSHDSHAPESFEQSFELHDDQPFSPQSRPRPPGAEDESDFNGPRRSYIGAGALGGLVKLAVIACIVGIIAAVFFWQLPHITQRATQWTSRSPPQVTKTPAQPTTPKFDGRVPQDQGPGQAQNAPPAANQAAPAVAQHAILYEADPAN